MMPTSTLTEKLSASNSQDSDPVRKVVSRSQEYSRSLGDSPSNLFAPGSAGRGRLSRLNSYAPSPTRTVHLKPFKEEDIRILLLENVNQTGRDALSQQGYQVESLKASLPEDQLIEKIKYGQPC